MNILTGIAMNDPFWTLGYGQSGRTGTESFFMKNGPWIGVTGIIRFFESAIIGKLFLKKLITPDQQKTKYIKDDKLL